jgi:hypothetical protein
MPMRSQKQRNAMFAAASGKGNIGIPKKVADEFVASDKGGKLPTRAKKKKKPPPFKSMSRGFTYRP